MSDLIDKQALLRQIDIDSDGEPGYYGDTWKFIDTIKRMPPAHDTNLAEVGTDCISRQTAIEALDEIEAEVADGYGYQYAKWREYFVEMPSAQPEIIRCKDCKHKPSGDATEHDITFPDDKCPCQCEDFWYSWIPSDDWYCGFAERRAGWMT